jgi:PHD/YefM family antitoxin component YafN of YafNO toxin-antitoxin module
MKTISAERFEARCLTIIDEVKHRREPLVITKNDLDGSVVVPSAWKGSGDSP